MYVCLCNGISDTAVRDAIAAGAKRLRDVYGCCGGRAQCGRCAAMMLAILRDTPAAVAA